MVVMDRTAQSKTKLPPLKERVRVCGVAAKSGISRKVVVAEEIEGGAMKIVASGTGNHVHRACVRNTRREIEICGGDLKLLHHFLGESHLRAERAHRHNAAAVHRDPRAAAPRSGVASRCP